MDEDLFVFGAHVFAQRSQRSRLECARDRRVSCSARSVTSSILVNDVLDWQDRRHPLKARGPIASGAQRQRRIQPPCWAWAR
jgi:hypothetical protein